MEIELYEAGELVSSTTISDPILTLAGKVRQVYDNIDSAFKVAHAARLLAALAALDIYNEPDLAELIISGFIVTEEEEATKDALLAPFSE